MRVVYLVSTLRRAGPTSQLLNIVRHLDSRQFEPTIVTLSPEPADSMRDAFEAASIPVRTLALSRLEGAIHRGWRRDIGRLLGAALDNRMVVHSQGIRGDVIASRRLAGLPRVATARNYPSDEYPMKFGPLAGRWMARSHFRAFRAHPCVVACSSTLSEQLREHGIAAAVIRNGVDTSVFRPAMAPERARLREQLGIPPAARVGVSIGALSTRKDPVVIVRAMKSIEDADLVLVFVGEGGLGGRMPARSRRGSAHPVRRPGDECRKLHEGGELPGLGLTVGRPAKLGAGGAGLWPRRRPLGHRSAPRTPSLDLRGGRRVPRRRRSRAGGSPPERAQPRRVKHARDRQPHWPIVSEPDECRSSTRNSIFDSLRRRQARDRATADPVMPDMRWTRGPAWASIDRDGLRFSIDRCISCGFVYVTNPSGTTFDHEQVAPLAVPEKPRHRQIKRICDVVVARRAPSGAVHRVVEVGAGWGGLAQVFARDGAWRYTGFEPSAARAAFGRARGFDVRAGLFDASGAAGVADAVVFDNVLEHVNDPRKLVRDAVASLRAGGVLIVIVPNRHDLRRFHPAWRDRHYWQPHCHINYFSQARSRPPVRCAWHEAALLRVRSGRRTPR